MSNYTAPDIKSKAFNCPKCNVFAHQSWYYLNAATNENGSGYQYKNNKFLISVCECCSEPTIWHERSMIYPFHTTAVLPSEDLPLEVRQDFEEARIIANLSPRGAAALLRLALQKLCKHLGQSGKNINEDVKNLVENGLPSKVQQALDTVRVIGNEAVHPGTLDLKDNRETVTTLFRLINFIADKMITEPREIEEIYGTLPVDKLAGIANRDSQ